jgi:predicted nucleic acid-binding protein
MSDIALDTNILLYRHNRPYDSAQRTIAYKLLVEKTLTIVNPFK